MSRGFDVTSLKKNSYMKTLAIRCLQQLLARPTGGSLASLGNTPPPLASLAKPRRGPLKKRLDLQVKPRPRMASEVGSEVTRSP